MSSAIRPSCNLSKVNREAAVIDRLYIERNVGMEKMKRTAPIAVVTIAATLILGQSAKTAWPALSASTRQSAQASLNKGLAYLRQNQKADGSWESHKGITGLAARLRFRNNQAVGRKTTRTSAKV